MFCVGKIEALGDSMRNGGSGIDYVIRNNVIEESEIKVSVICLTYNHEKYVREMLESIVNQVTDFRYEIIVHDDASTDKTQEIIKEYARRYPHMIIPVLEEENQYSKGQGILLKKACERIRGKYCAWCEGDDYWCDPHKLEQQYLIMRNHPECSICVHRVDCIYPDGSKHPVSKPDKDYDMREGYISEENMQKALWKLGGYPFQTSSYFLKREVIWELIKLGESETWTAYANGDMQMLMISLCQGGCFYIDRVMSKWRQGNEGSYSSQKLQWTVEQHKEEFIKGLKRDELYDEYSHQHFHEYIVTARIRQILGKSKINGVETKENLKKFKVSITDILKYASKKEEFYYFCICLHPQLLSYLVLLKRKLERLIKY